MKLTPIFPAHIKPVRVGVYKVTGYMSDREPSYYSYWDGKYWRTYYHSVDGAFEGRHYKSAVQDKRWQGVAHE